MRDEHDIREELKKMLRLSLELKAKQRKAKGQLAAKLLLQRSWFLGAARALSWALGKSDGPLEDFLFKEETDGRE